MHSLVAIDQLSSPIERDTVVPLPILQRIEEHMQTTHLFDEKKMELFPGIDAQIFPGKQIMVMRVSLEQGAIATAHDHSHEQISIVLQGEMEFTIGEEQKTLKTGDAVVIPSDVTHSAKAIVKCELIEVFSPVREDLVKRYSNV